MSEAKRNLRDYIVVSGAYWVFTVTDGALRMLILFYLYAQGYTPISIASLFIVYEFSGVVTNLMAGWIGARFGLKSTLLSGLFLQLLVCLGLGFFPGLVTIAFLSVIQLASGVAKDLTKMSSKSYIKLVVPEDENTSLMKWVSLLTGSKNALKGVGFFFGSWSLHALGLAVATQVMAVALAVALVCSMTMLPSAQGKAKKPKFSQVLSKDSRLNWLSFARLFLFGSRDIWFALALPIYMHAELGWSYSTVGAFMAAWVIGYGVVQASAPRFTSGRSDNGQRTPPHAGALIRWTFALLLPLCGIVATQYMGVFPALSIVGGLMIFGGVFAANSAIHSYLVVHYADKENVAMNVGFYYMANATGRLVGTILSGVLYEFAGGGTSGLLAALIGSGAFVLISGVACRWLRQAELRQGAALS